MTAGELIGALERGPMERLRWRVLRTFSVLPCSRQARRMTDAQCLRIAAALAAERLDGGTECLNSAFDEKKFERLREGGAWMRSTDS